ncbi:MAG: hypothetical protein EBT43_05730 [Methylocystaceae bacterium]|nr:hypothetical protein [Methylocystaceae bacterium]
MLSSLIIDDLNYATNQNSCSHNAEHNSRHHGGKPSLKRTYTRFTDHLRIILIAKNIRYRYKVRIAKPSKLEENLHDPCSAKTQKIN